MLIHSHFVRLLINLRGHSPVCPLDAIFSLVAGISLLFAPSVFPADQTGYHPNRILVKMSSEMDLLRSKTLHAVFKTQVLRAHPEMGGWQVLQIPSGASVSNILARLRRVPGIEFAEPDYRVHASLDPNDADFQRQLLWGLNNTNNVDIDAPEGWAIRHSAPEVIVAVIDSGIRATHEDLVGNLWTNPGEIPDNGVDDDGNGYNDDVHGINAINSTGNPADDNGHGTHVSGIIGAVGNNGKGIAGVAWKIQLMSCKFLDQHGEGYISDAIACLDYARRQGAHILNLSWSDAEFSLALQSALARAQEAGILMTAAAGNRKSDNDVAPNYPSCFEFENLISVASVNRFGDLSRSSNFGLRQVDLAAPGESIYSTYNSWDFDYVYTGGTSMAAAYVSGILALLKAEYPAENCPQLISRLLGSVKPLASLKGRCRSGGLASLAGALADVPLIDLSPSPLAGAVPFVVTFTNRSSGLLTQYHWDFGDGSPPVGTAQAAHRYDQEGRYQAAFVATDSNGLIHRRTFTVVALANYQIEPAPTAWVSLTNNPLPWSPVGIWREIRLPFLFTFYGQDYDAVYVASNGILSFAEKAFSPASPVLPHQGTMGPVICPFAFEEDPSLQGTIRYGIDGPSPRRRLVVTWEGLTRSGSVDHPLTFQAILFEETGEISFQYREVNDSWIQNGGRAPVIGVGDSSGQVAAVYPLDHEGGMVSNNLSLRILPTTSGGLRVSPLYSLQVPQRPRTSGAIREYHLSNTSRQALPWEILHSQDWISLSSSNGILDPGQSAVITVAVNSEAAVLKSGLYQDFLHFLNLRNGYGNTSRSAALWIRNNDAIQLSIDSLPSSLGLRISGEPRLLCRLEASSDLWQWVAVATNRLSSAGQWSIDQLPLQPHPGPFFRAVELWELPDMNGVCGENSFQ